MFNVALVKLTIDMVSTDSYAVTIVFWDYFCAASIHKWALV